MQPALPFEVTDVPVVYVRHRRARRYILRLLADGTLRVTLPRWGAKREAEAFVRQSRAWIEKQQQLRRDAPQSEPWRDGSHVLIDGVPARLSIEAGEADRTVRCGAAVVTPPSGRSHAADLRTMVQRWLRVRATSELPPLVQAHAASLGIAVSRVTIRDQRSRWGSCSRQGSITLNWRLLQMPPFVREYIVIHELMHRREMNHSPRFWRHVAGACPRYLEARKWLRTEGKKLL
jgi:predicted metal-dependent hydrolase